MPKASPEDSNHPLAAVAYDNSRFLRVGPLTVHYVGAELGTTPLYLAHHFYGSGANFRPLINHLDVTTVALDRPGFGLTERPKATGRTQALYTRRGAAKLAWEVLTHLYGTAPVVIAGASAGGTHVLEMAALNPQQVRGVILIDAAVTGDVGPPGWARPLLRAPLIRTVGVALVERKAHTVTAQRVGRSWANPTLVTKEILQPYKDAARMPGYAYGLYHSFVADAPPDLRPVLTTLRAKTLVISGANDPVIAPRDAQRIAHAIPNATFVELANAGHTPHEEQPAEVARAITRFLASL